MSVDAALITALKADAALMLAAPGGVFTFGGKQGATYPYVTLQRISTSGAAHLDGPSNLDWPRFQIDSWGTTALDALNAAEAVRAAIDHVWITGSPDFYASFQNQSGPAPDEETRNFRVSQDYFLFHERT